MVEAKRQEASTVPRRGRGSRYLVATRTADTSMSKKSEPATVRTGT
jgi:hypothetical protein